MILLENRKKSRMRELDFFLFKNIWSHALVHDFF